MDENTVPLSTFERTGYDPYNSAGAHDLELREFMRDMSRRDQEQPIRILTRQAE